MQSQTYYITSVKDTSFDPDQFGNKFYSIEVEGVQGNLLWKTKNRPNTGISVYGHIEPSKSGKSNLFKRDQKPEDYKEPSRPAFSDSLLQQPQQQSPVSTSGNTVDTAKIMGALRELYRLVKENNDLLKGVDNRGGDTLLTPEEEAAIALGGSVAPLEDDPFKD